MGRVFRAIKGMFGYGFKAMVMVVWFADPTYPLSFFPLVRQNALVIMSVIDIRRSLWSS